LIKFMYKIIDKRLRLRIVRVSQSVDQIVVDLQLMILDVVEGDGPFRAAVVALRIIQLNFK
jgi:hypothetical protein